ncbi:MAG: IS110 family transposase, partial [Actinomycetota bacterium]|nr:IS110 family transposase [Actinomycetota bacterium]
MSNTPAVTIEPTTTVIVGVDTHKHVHVAVAINALGARLGDYSAPADRAGYATLVTWARSLGAVHAFGIEGTGSYGVGSRESCPTARHQGGGGQSLRSPQTPQQWEERHDRRGGRSAGRAGRDRDRDPENG